MIGKAIFNLLSNDAPVAAIVGANIQPYLSIENTAYP